MVKSADRGTVHMMEIGAHVRVKESVVIYHHPQHRNQPFDLQGQEGEITAIVKEWHGRPVSANFPVVVKIGAKLKVHLQETELEVI